MFYSASFNFNFSAVAYGHLGDSIVAGLGGSTQHAKCGTFVVLHEEDLTLVYEARDSTKAVSVVKYSPDGETLAVASEDGTIYLYAVNDEYELIGRCLRHTAPVAHIDFSIDGEWLRSNSLSGEWFFFSTDDASFQSNIASMRDIEWSTSTCVYNWHVKDVSGSCWIGETVTSLHAPSLSWNHLACGTDKGYIKVHCYPCPVDGGYFQRYEAHVGEISTIRFNADVNAMMTCGRYDRAIIIWKVINGYSFSGVAEVEEVDSDDFALEIAEDSEIDDENMPSSCQDLDAYISTALGNDIDNKFQSTCKIWLESVVNPSNQQQQRRDVPEVSVVLEYVYGYRSQDMRNNIRYCANGDVAYICSTLGIVMNRSNRAQKYYGVGYNYYLRIWFNFKFM